MKKILIAEDNIPLQKIYKTKLEKSGYEVEVVPDGAVLEEKLKTYTPDIILLDLIMPIKDGFTTLKELSADPKYNKIPIIVTSNLGQQEDAKKALALGAKDYIVKSDTSLSGVIAKVEAYLNA